MDRRRPEETKGRLVAINMASLLPLRAVVLEQNRPGERLQGRHAAWLRCRPRPAVHRQGAHRREGERPLTKSLTCWVLGGRVGAGKYSVYSILQSLQDLHTFATL